MRIYKDKGKTKGEYQTLREFMSHSWHELPGSRPELNYMSATCAVCKVYTSDIVMNYALTHRSSEGKGIVRQGTRRARPKSCRRIYF